MLVTLRRYMIYKLITYSKVHHTNIINKKLKSNKRKCTSKPSRQLVILIVRILKILILKLLICLEHIRLTETGIVKSSVTLLKGHHYSYLEP